MGGVAKTPQQISPSDDRGRRSSRIRFPEGSLIEVRTDAKGTGGVYFSATVIPPPPSTTIPPRKKSRKLLYVEYHNLLAGDDDRLEPLREYVDVSLVRPAPPPSQEEENETAGRGFKQDDVVDASSKDAKADGEKQREDGALDSDDGGREAASSVLPSEVQSLPFAKDKNASGIWETIESMRVFQRIPQKPHFQPLERFEESLREGLAIGYMVSFASLVEKAYRLQLNDPKSIIDEMMETLVEMEGHGFDVSLVQDRLSKLLDLKAKKGKLADELNDFNHYISEHNQDKKRMEEEIRETKEQMRKLQEKLALAELAKEKKDDEIALLQAGLKEAEESMKVVECDYEGVASSILLGEN